MKKTAYDTSPLGRLSAKKLCTMANELNAMLSEVNAKHYIEVGQRYNYYAVDVLTTKQHDYRNGDKTPGNSGIARTYDSGLTARQCQDAMIKAYYEFDAEVS